MAAIKPEVIVGTVVGLGEGVRLDNGNVICDSAILNGRLRGRRVRITIEVLPKDKSRG